MKPTQLKYFEAVYKYKNITEAANSLFVTQPTITISIKDMERELGYKLLNRSGNKIFITDEGEAFHKISLNLLTEFAEFEKAAYDLNVHRTSELRLGIPPVLSSFIFQKLHPGFGNEYPAYKLHVTEVQNKVGLKMLTDGELDLMVGISEGHKQPSFDAFMVGEYSLYLFAHKDNPLCRLKSVGAEDLRDVPFVSFVRDSFHFEAVQRYYGHNHLDIILESNQVSTVQYMVANNLAVTITYKEIFNDVKNVKKVPLQEPIDANIFVFKRKDSFESAAIKKFTAFLKQSLSTL